MCLATWRWTRCPSWWSKSLQLACCCLLPWASCQVLLCGPPAPPHSTSLRTITDPPLAELSHGKHGSAVTGAKDLFLYIHLFIYSFIQGTFGPATFSRHFSVLRNNHQQDREGASSKCTFFRLLVPATNLAGTVLPPHLQGAGVF